MNKEEALLIQKEISNADNIVLFLHLSPDGDSIGSNIAFKYYLESLGKSAKILTLDLPPQNLLDSINIDIAQFEVIDPYDFDFSSTDLVVTLDTAFADRVSRNPEILKKLKSLNLLNIDHHIVKEKMTDKNVVYPNKASTTVLVYEYFNLINYRITSEIASALILGIYTDTASFSNFNVDSYIFKIMQDLLAIGADYQKIIISINEKSPDYFKTVAALYTNLKYVPNQRFAYSFVSLEDRKKYGIDDNYTIIEIANLVKGISGEYDFVVVFNEASQDYTKLSFRALKPNIDVEKIALQFKGGGHKAASGAKIYASINHAIETFLNNYSK